MGKGASFLRGPWEDGGEAEMARLHERRPGCAIVRTLMKKLPFPSPPSSTPRL